ncbi:tannase and feruloyl esterase [Mycena metata]|uniref:Carboxylic ester hydrolase n=1 Tax=Mycena metata TaxID=1033252 RepID=A0AAD7HUQ4_9AGAR|nr:tannase and feruloyl esterase [Mycena metata]
MHIPDITFQFLAKVLTGSLSLFSTWSPDRRDKEPHAACLALKSSLKLENTTVTDTSYVLVGSTIGGTGHWQCSWGKTSVHTAVCRVQFFTNTTDTSSVRAEAWLPDEWYGRFLATGNGGLGGCIDYWSLDYAASLHFAAVGSNNGHDGMDGDPFLNNPEVINDFAFRAIHVETVIGKQITEAYYGRPHDKAYYSGCSTGGRQGAQAALKYPTDFDGILAGAPATDFNHLLHWAAMLGRAIGAPNPSSSPAFIPPAMWKVISAEILQQCDGVDGVLDGIISEPDLCVFRPERLLCTSGRPLDSCLTPPQVAALHKIYSPVHGRHGDLVYPRFDPGAEGDPLAPDLFSGQLSILFQHWLKYAVLNDTEFDFSNYGFDELEIMDAINPGGIATWNGNFSAFRDRGGKFLTYHGRSDPLIPSGNSKRMYDLLTSTLRSQATEFDAFYRLFLIPGMSHCIGGLGATRFGQCFRQSNAVNTSSHNILLALVDWVEGDVAPDTIVGTEEQGGATRMHCRYPMQSVWNGEVFACMPGPR